MRQARAFMLMLLLSACIAAPAPTPPDDPPDPPRIELASVVTDVRIFAEHYEFTDAAGTVHAIEIGTYRELGGHGCCGPLLVLGTDDDGPFLASFATQEGLPGDCYVENAPGIDRGSSIEILGVLWRKAPGFRATVPIGTGYPPGTRFCFGEHGLVTRVLGR